MYEEVKIKSLKKGIDILNCFVEEQPLGVSEISRKLGFNKSVVHNILSTFVSMDYLEKDEISGKYYLGNALYYLCDAVKNRHGLMDIFIPYMQKIADESNELVYMTIPSKDEVIYCEAVYPKDKSSFYSSVSGERCKMYCTSVGKAMLAHYDNDKIHELVGDEFETFTDYTISNYKDLIKEIELIRKRGYAFDNMESALGIKCVGMVVLNKKGNIVAGLSISTPSLRMEDDKVQFFVNILQKNIREIEKML